MNSRIDIFFITFKLFIGIFRTEWFIVERSSQICHIGPGPLDIYLNTVIQIDQVMVASGPEIRKLVNYIHLSPTISIIAAIEKMALTDMF